MLDRAVESSLRERAADQVAGAASAYLNFLTHEGRAAHTLAGTRLDLDQLAGYVGRKRVGEIGTDDLRAFLRWLARQRANGSSSLRRKTSTVKGFFTYLYATGRLSVDPAAALTYPAAEEERATPLRRAEIDHVLAGARAPSWRVLVALIADCGLKRDEVVAARWEDIEGVDGSEAGLLHIRRRQASRKVRRRTLEVSARLAAALHEHGNDPSQRVGPILAISARGVDFVVETAARRGGVRPDRKVTPQMLRDGFALRRLHEMGAKETAEPLGSEGRRRLEREHDLVLLRELGLSDRSDAARRFRRILGANQSDWAE